MPTFKSLLISLCWILASSGAVFAQEAAVGADELPTPVLKDAAASSGAESDPPESESSALAVPVGTRDSEQVLMQVVDRQELHRELVAQHSALKDHISTLRPNVLDKWLPAIFGFLAALLGAGVAAGSSFLLQRQRLRFEREAARRSAGIKELASIYEFRGRQLNEFYAPLEALLLQGFIVRSELYKILESSEGERFSYTLEKGRGSKSLYVKHDGEKKKPFKLIDEMGFLKKEYPHVMSIISETVRINRLIVDLIHKKVGLVLHENAQLSEELGLFLAHHSVLEEVFRQNGEVMSESPGITGEVKFVTAFPRDMPSLVKKDCERLRKDLRLWEADVSSWAGRSPSALISG